MRLSGVRSFQTSFDRAPRRRAPSPPVEHRQIEPAEPLRIGKDVDLGDLPAADGLTGVLLDLSAAGAFHRTGWLKASIVGLAFLGVSFVRARRTSPGVRLVASDLPHGVCAIERLWDGPAVGQ